MRRKIGTLIVFSYLCKTMQEKDKNTSNSAWVSRLMNKYTITLLIFLVWLAFFDRNSLVGKMQLRGKIATLKKENACSFVRTVSSICFSVPETLAIAHLPDLM